MGAQIREVELLHAKVYASETEALVSSFNLVEESEKNRELTVAIRGGKGLARVHALLSGLSHDEGHCVRCDLRIAFDLEHPLCRSCFQEWDEYGNEDYPEKLCHRCGTPAKVTFAKPLCRPCFAST